MEDLITKIIEYLLPTHDAFLYIFLFLSAVIENLFPPIPGDTITAFGAFLVGSGRLNYLLVYLSTTLGSVVGFMILFLLGRYLGKQFFVERDYKYFSAQKIITTEKWFSKYGYLVVLVNRFFPGIRSVISLVSGITMLNTVKVLIFSIISASIWNLVWIHAGYLLGYNWYTVKEKIGNLLRGYNLIASIIMVLFVIGFIVFMKSKKGGKKSV
jgi:membrane protein DedA with SNARE-associated domain